MKRISYLVVCVTVLAAFSIIEVLGSAESDSKPADQEKKIAVKPQIRWKFEQGKTITYKYTESADVAITGESNVPGMESIENEIKVNAEGSLEFVPNDDGSARLTMNMRQSQTKSDSEDSMPMPDAGSEADSPGGVKVVVTFKPDGTVAMEDDENKALLTWARSTLDKLFQMPENPTPQPGDSWDKKLEYLSEQDEAIEGTITTTFSGWMDQTGSKVAKLEFSLITKMDKEEGYMKVNMDLKGQGVWLFDPSLGRVVSSNFEYNLDMKTVMNFEGGEGIESKGIHMEIFSKGEGNISLQPQQAD